MSLHCIFFSTLYIKLVFKIQFWIILCTYKFILCYLLTYFHTNIKKMDWRHVLFSDSVSIFHFKMRLLHVFLLNWPRSSSFSMYSYDWFFTFFFLYGSARDIIYLKLLNVVALNQNYLLLRPHTNVWSIIRMIWNANLIK